MPSLDDDDDLPVRPVPIALTVALVAALATGCGGHRAAYPPTPGYSTEQVIRVFKAQGLPLSHFPPLEREGRGHMIAVLHSTEPGTVLVSIYKSSTEARLAAAIVVRKNGVRVNRYYRYSVVANVFAIAAVLQGDRSGRRASRHMQAAMARLGTLKKRHRP